MVRIGITGGIAVGAPKVAGGQADENTGQTRKGALALQAQVNFVYDQRLGHSARNLQMC